MALSPSIGGLIGKGGTPSGGNDTRVTFWGLSHFKYGLGNTVSVQLCGQDCGDFDVSNDGSVTVPLFGTTIVGGGAGGADVSGVVTLASIIADGDVYNIEQAVPIQIQSGGVTSYINVPCVIGRAYVTQGQRLRPAAQDDIKSKSGAALAMTRRGHMFGVLVKDAVLASFGTSFTPTPTGDMIDATFTGPDGYSALPRATGFDGVWWETWADDYSFDSELCWQIARPWPFVLCASTSFISTEERS